jgi:AcrR family transcriptional regulator
VIQQISQKSSPAASPPTPSGEARDRILLAAGREFAERGYEAATVRDICLAAGVNGAAVNYYFGDKKRLYIESGNMLERMLGLGQPPWQVQLMLREVLQPTEACRELVEDYFRPHFQLLVSILDELTGGRLDGPTLRRAALSVIGQCFLYRAAGDVVGMLVPPGELETLHTPPQIADHVTHFTLAALGAGPALPHPAPDAALSEPPSA